jgi:hypothetical protein
MSNANSPGLGPLMHPMLSRDEHIAKSVFINCPYDDQYRSMFDTIVFTLLDIGFLPRSALEIDTAIQSRYEKICQIIESCRFGIHDISRVCINERTGLAQLNMPFELGLFLGSSRFGAPTMIRRDCIIIGGRKGEHNLAISDLSGHDIAYHEDDHANLVQTIRAFFSQRSPGILPGTKYIMQRRALFETELPSILRDLKLSYTDLTFTDFSRIAQEWLMCFQEEAALRAAQSGGSVTVTHAVGPIQKADNPS